MAAKRCRNCESELGGMAIAADKRLFYADHVVMGLHYFAFLMIYLILDPVVLGLLSLAVPVEWQVGQYLGLIAVLLQFLYVPGKLRTALGMSWFRALISTPLFVLALFITHFIYRLIQFIVAFALVGAV